MRNGPNISIVSSLVADPARASILTLLIGGEALTANELATEAGVAAPTASGHLSRLLDGGLVAVEKQGRHRYYRLAGAEVAEALESLMTLARATESRRVRPGPRDPALRKARVCYDHLAGEVGVELFRGLADRGTITLTGGDIGVTGDGEARLTNFGIDVESLRHAKRPLCRTCLDWSERTPHLAGGLGAALLDGMLARKWARRAADSRALVFSSDGERLFRAFLAG